MVTGTPNLPCKADWIWDRVYVAVVDGTIPASDSQVYDGKDLNKLTVLSKKSTTS